MKLPVILRYTVAVVVRAKLYLGGGSAIIVCLALYQGISGSNVPPIVYISCASLTVISAIFVYGLEQYRELEPRLSIGDPEYYNHNSPRLTHCYRLPVGNKSEAKTIRNATVQLVDIYPKPQPYTWGRSMPLQWKDTIKPQGSTLPVPITRDIRAGTPEEVDFVQAMIGDPFIVVNHAAERIDQRMPIPSTNYHMTIEVKGDDVPSAKAVFKVWVDKHGKLQCVPLGSY